MSAQASNGSPPPWSHPSTHFVIHKDLVDSENSSSSKASRQVASVSEAMLDLKVTDHRGKNKHTMNISDGPLPLTTSKLGNIQTPTLNGSASHKKAKVSHDAAKDELQESTMNALLAKLADQQQETAKKPVEAGTVPPDEKQTTIEADLPPSSATITPAIHSPVRSEAKGKEDEAISIEGAEMLRLKNELEAAKHQLEMQKRELDQNRILNHTLDQAMGLGSAVEGEVLNTHRGGHNTGPKPQHQKPPFATSYFGNLNLRQDGGDNFSDTSDICSNADYNNLPPNNWSTARPPLTISPPRQQLHQPVPIWGQSGLTAAAARPFNARVPIPAQGMPPAAMMHPQPMPQHRILSGPASPGTIGDGRFVNDFNQFQSGFGLRRHNVSSPRNDAQGPHHRNNNSGWPVLGNGMGNLEAMNLSINPNNAYQPMGMYQSPLPYQPRPIGTPLSATAAEFQADQPPPGPWNTVAATSPGQVYVQPMEPLNYRRLLDRSVSCNWKYIVDKIVCNNDQQASIFLQQKLKVGTVEQKYEIIEAIVAQAYPLMINRFGNFLVQRCFEHGTPEQVVAIANAIRGNTLNLSMDAFGCHVVQKAFDAVPEEYKAIMVHELLRRIPETVIHRYACHVWQKLFELRWSDSPPQIMKFVNEALRGMWHDVALGETGSLVVQNIFENCLEEDKRPCINEVLNNIDIVAHGQFGNWCIQHICEHGAPQDRSRAIDHVLRYSTEYSMDQFASKVVEKCLKIGGPEFLERYLERVCEGRQDRPRIPLIDIASDQYGNYLIQYILTHANNTHREIVASNVRKHMVSLRGSKFGSRVGMLCCNPAYATHPGPGVGMSNTRYSSAPAQNPRFGGAYR
ncbi:MAG: hypothetical protein Q9223_005247 [Gallowayella weberi]